MDVVRSLADRIIVLHNGRLAADGEPAEVIASPIVQEAYLGVAPEAAAMSERLVAQGVHTHIGRYHILQGVDFDAPAGKTTMLLGRNGAGKTTCLRTIMGLWRASHGAIRLGERADLRRSPPSAVARAGVAYVPETMAIFSDLSVKENLVLGRARRAARRGAAAWIFGFFPALKKFWLSRAGSLSGGQKQMVSIARAIIEPRRLLLIDEPTKGLAPAIIGGLIDCLKEIKRSGATILLVEQNFRVAREVGDFVRVMDNGRIVHRRRDGGTRRRQGAAKPAARPLPGFAPMSATDAGAALPRASSDSLPALTPLIVARGRRAADRLALDLRDADARGSGDGHDDLHHGVAA